MSIYYTKETIHYTVYTVRERHAAYIPSVPVERTKQIIIARVKKFYFVRSYVYISNTKTKCGLLPRPNNSFMWPDASLRA